MAKLPHRKKFWNSADIIGVLGVKQDAFKAWVKQGAPRAVKGRGYPGLEFFKWLVDRPIKKRDSLPLHEKANDAYLELLNKDNKTIDTAKSGANLPADRPKQEPGLVAALDRARCAELAAYENHLNIQAQQGTISASALDAWQKTLDILRKCEKDFTEVLKSRKELVETAKVQEWLEGRIEQAKTMLLNLPAKLAPSLESLPWHEIQKRLTQEIRDAISKLETFN